jgi:O-antigen ligase
MRASLTADSIANVNDAGSTLVRLQRAVIGWLIFLDHKLVGVGIGLAPEVYPSYGWNWTQFDGGAHDAYLQRLCETGLVGLTGYVVFLIHYFRSVIRRLRSSVGSDRPVWAGFVVFGIVIVMDGFFSELLSGIGLIFLMIALAYVFSHFEDQKTPRPQGGS